MDLINDLKSCVEALEKAKDISLDKALNAEGCQADIAAGQYYSYAVCYNLLLELLIKHKRV